MRLLRFLWRCISRVIGFLGWLNPWRNLQAQALKSYPLLWRSYAVHVIWYLTVASVLFYLAGSLIRVDPDNIYNIIELKLLRSAIWIATGLLACYWVLLLVRTPLPDLRPRRLLATILVYSLCIHLMISLPHAFLLPLAASVADTVPSAEYDADHEFLERYNYGFCNGDLDDGVAQRFGDLLTRHNFKHGAVKIVSAKEARGEWDWTYAARISAICPNGWSDSSDNKFIAIETASGFGFTSPPLDLLDRFTSLEFAGTYARPRGLLGIMGKLFSPGTAMLSVWVAAVLAFLTYSRGSMGPRTRSFIPRWLRRTSFPGWFAPRALRSLDLRLLRRRPRLWATRIPVVTTFFTLLVLLSVPVAWFLDYSSDAIPFGELEFIDGDLLKLIFIICMFIGFVAVLIFLMREQRRKITRLETLGDHLVAMSAFMVPPLPGLALLLLFGKLSDDNEVYYTAMFAAFVVFLASTVSYLLLVSKVKHVFASLAYVIISIVAYIVLLIFAGSIDLFLFTFNSLCALYLLMIAVTGFKNRLVKGMVRNSSSYVWVDIARYMMVISIFAPYLTLMYIGYLLDQIGLHINSSILEVALVLALTFGHIPVFFLLCCPMYAAFRNVYHRPAAN